MEDIYFLKLYLTLTVYILCCSDKMVHIPDTNSQVNLCSIEDTDVGEYLVHDEMNDSFSQYMEGINIPTLRDDEEDNNNVDGEETLSPGNDNNEPILGKLFASMDDAHTFYNHYAMTKGFGIRKHRHSRSRSTRQIMSIYVCSKQG